MGLPHSQVKSQVIYSFLQHFCSPLNTSLIFCHHLHHCLQPMKATIKINPQGTDPTQLPIHQQVASMNTLNNLIYFLHLSLLDTYSNWLDSRPHPPFHQPWETLARFGYSVTYKIWPSFHGPVGLVLDTAWA